MSRKKALGPLYLKYKPRWIKHELHMVEHPDGYLFSCGKYHTKVRPQDLPEWYVYGYMYKQYGYISAKGVKEMCYVPNYVFDHLYKDDALYISYSREIEKKDIDDRHTAYRGYDCVLIGPIIVEFIEAAQKYSNYNTSEICTALKQKEAWYRNKVRA